MQNTPTETPLVSVIVPIYNVERYLKQCLNSIIKQSYKNLEIILVNDASPDGSLTLCKQFAECDSRITIIDKKVNEGLEMARFSGLDVAEGDYIYFIDSDDWLARRDIIELMVKKAEETGADYIWMRLQRVMGKHEWIKQNYTLPEEGVISQKKLMEKYYLLCYGWPTPTPYLPDKLYRHSTLLKANIKPSGLRIAEDTYFNLQLFPHLKTVYFLNIVGYNYRWGGMWGRTTLDPFTVQKEILRLKISEAIKNNFPKGEYQARLFYLAVCESNIMLMLASHPQNKVKEVLIKELEDPFWDEVLQPEKYPDMFQTPFMQALAARDVDRMIELSLPAAKRHRRMARIKKIANAILSRI